MKNKIQYKAAHLSRWAVLFIEMFGILYYNIYVTILFAKPFTINT